MGTEAETGLPLKSQETCDTRRRTGLTAALNCYTIIGWVCIPAAFIAAVIVSDVRSTVWIGLRHIDLAKVTLVVFLPIAVVLNIAGIVASAIAVAKSRKVETSSLRKNVIALVVPFLGVILAVIICPRSISAGSGLRHPCLKNLGQLSVALMTYSEDHDALPDPNKWCDQILPYLGSTKPFVCPNASRQAKETGCTYALNPNAAFHGESQCVLLFETDGGWNRYGGLESVVIGRHAEGGNVSFLDGHTASVPADELPKLKWKARDSNNVK